MSLPVHTVRRATINDLAALRSMWSVERFAVGELERRFTEFQVVEAAEGKVIGALALQIQGNQGLIHSEAIGSPEHTEGLRAVLWERIKKVAINHGLARLWTPAVHTHFTQAEFRVPTEAEQGKRPSQFGESAEGWLMLPLKEETAQTISLEQELALFREAQKAEAEAFQQHAKKWKLMITAGAFLFLILVFSGAYYYWYQYLRNPDKFNMPEHVPAANQPAAPAAPVAPTNAPVPKLLPPPPTNPPVTEPKTALGKRVRKPSEA
ncbi:MAG: hypothetical protein K0Q55_1365 [Verrucomicrobia bacterium]|nr:hypothetical protein [Verrucomicrobiota bacterium]